MLYALTSAYSRKDYDNHQRGLPLQTKIGKLFAVFAWGLDIVQEQAKKIKSWDNLDNAQGSVLDRYGGNFGVKRNGASDAFYRLNIKVKVLAQLSGGDADTVINAVAELLGVEMTDVLLEDNFPAKIELYVDQGLLSEDRLEMLESIAWAIKRILAAGVGMRLYERTYRTYRLDIPVVHGGAIGTFFYYQPAGEDRTAVLPLPVAHSGAVVTNFDAALPVGEDRACSQPVPVAYGGHLSPTITGALSGSRRSGKVRQNGAETAYIRTHIRARRIN